MYYAPAETNTNSVDVLYVHPFASEMFASRNLIAALARELSSAGVGVLTVDLYGCGDSSGDFGDARWEIWRDDLSAAARWLETQGRDRLCLWGLRIGALLAMDFAVQSQSDYEKIVLWQPVLSGSAMLTQFFRTNLDEADRSMFSGQLIDPAARRAVQENQPIDIAGYEMSWELVRAIDSLEIAPQGKAVSAPIHWTEIGERAEAPLSADSLRVIAEWKRNGVSVTTHKSVGLPFWFFPHCTDAGRLVSDVKATFCDDYGDGR
jgi:exosortase A-associated hydrolase 2